MNSSVRPIFLSQPYENKTAELDSQIQEVLQDSSLNPDQRLQKYLHRLREYLIYRSKQEPLLVQLQQQQQTAVETPELSPDLSAAPELSPPIIKKKKKDVSPQELKNKIPVKNIISAIPEKYHGVAEALLKHSGIVWNEFREIVSDKKFVPRSNIANILKYHFGSKSDGTKPKGYNEFVKNLWL